MLGDQGEVRGGQEVSEDGAGLERQDAHVVEACGGHAGLEVGAGGPVTDEHVEDVTPSPRPRGRVEHDAEPLLDSHVADVDDEEGLTQPEALPRRLAAAFQGQLEETGLGPVGQERDLLGSDPLLEDPASHGDRERGDEGSPPVSQPLERVEDTHGRPPPEHAEVDRGVRLEIGHVEHEGRPAASEGRS